MDARESQVYTVVVLACFVVGSIILYYIYSAIRQQKRVLEMERKNAGAEVTALEKDRARIATDLHDELAPMLAAVRMRINSFDLPEPGDRVQLEKTNQNIDAMAARMRAIAFDLMPASLLRNGLFTALHELVAAFSKKNGLTIKLLTPEQPPPVPGQKAIHIYRMVQEIIHNTIKHAGASELLILLENNGLDLQVKTRDNGIGFDYTAKQNQGIGLGLRSLQNRATLLQGALHVDSKPGQGTAFVIQIPNN